MIHRGKIITILIVLLILLAFESFSMLPYARYVKAVVSVIGALGILLFFLRFRLFPRSMQLLGLLLICVMFISIYSVYTIQGSGFLDAVQNNLAFFTIGLSFLIYSLVVRFAIQLEESVYYLKLLVWFIFGLAVVSFLAGTTGVKDAYGNIKTEPLHIEILLVSSILFLVQYFNTNTLKYLVLSLILFSSSQWYDFQRYVLFVYLIMLILLSLYHSKRISGLRFIWLSFLFLPIFWIFLVGTKSGQQITQRVSYALEIVNVDEASSEYSISARVKEIDYALKSIVVHPILGIGKPRIDKDDLNAKNYFFVSDVGVIGILYAFGLFGLFIYFMQIRYSFLSFIRFDRQNMDQESFGLIMYLLFLMIFSFVTARSMIKPGEFMVILAMLEAQKLLSIEKAELTQ